MLIGSWVSEILISVSVVDCIFYGSSSLKSNKANFCLRLQPYLGKKQGSEKYTITEEKHLHSIWRQSTDFASVAGHLSSICGEIRAESNNEMKIRVPRVLILRQNTTHEIHMFESIIVDGRGLFQTHYQDLRE